MKKIKNFIIQCLIKLGDMEMKRMGYIEKQ